MSVLADLRDLEYTAFSVRSFAAWTAGCCRLEVGVNYRYLFLTRCSSLANIPVDPFLQLLVWMMRNCGNVPPPIIATPTVMFSVKSCLELLNCSSR